jgi:DNA-binding CsgD family transcriptional regulator
MIYLTNRERQVLHLISIELSNLQISKELDISKSTVDKYRRNLLWKFDCKNSVGVIRKAYEQGILPITNNLGEEKLSEESS